MNNLHIKDQTKVDKLVLDEMALSDFNHVLTEKLFYNPVFSIKYWEDGYYKKIGCEINKFDSERNKLEVLDNGEKVMLSMDCIVEID